MGALADIIMEVLVLESVILRTEKMAGTKPLAVKMTKYYAARSFRIVENAAERVIAAVAEGDMLRTQMTIFRRLSKHEPENTVAIGREIAVAMTEADVTSFNCLEKRCAFDVSASSPGCGRKCPHQGWCSRSGRSQAGD